MPASIMVVDDTPANLRLLCSMLSENGYEVRPVTDGTMAIAAARAAQPNLILLDINMPGMNGYEVCDALKADEHLANIPVIFISALNETMDKVRAFEVGGLDYISKPFQIEEVLARIETHLTLRLLRHELQDANYHLENRNRQLERVNTFFLSTLKYMDEVVQRGATEEELRGYIKQAGYEFDRLV